ncbi:AAL167Wp [Eremothecium gossypii ATCC 10895]|uniref:AAL167Wp n=1 Tax=Eremothecium gossypii (strain ATCC 10895 / CBS 109.51 / FGSC 9923 / NRRL Y-1056) TaxID=284811 RepID=Q75FA6_EREGS|nr:AAL167Wp [Eremothecium gossypii ATCC 10895]AAS50199.1 AAL167Wp [Eremothecium gossypii ATCC 10895]AEY94484.1 FAAL167Wp [Eremothecium gossypii FDAG1]
MRHRAKRIMNRSAALENEYFHYFSRFIYSYVDLSDNTALLMLKFYPDGVHNPYRTPYNYTAQIYSNFLNSTRTGSAQRDYGINFETFLSGVLISVIYCLCQTLLFSYLRTRLPRIYQPNVFLTEHPVAPVVLFRNFKTKLFSWVHPTWNTPLESYKKYGLDSFFFLRYLKVLCLYFLILSVMTIPVLIPIHYTSGYQVLDVPGNSREFGIRHRHTTEGDRLLTQFSLKSTGLDEISMSNISPRHSSRLIFHFILGIFAVVWFHATLITELDYFVTQRNSAFLGEDPAAQKQQCAMFLNNIPDMFMSSERGLLDFFHSMIPDSVHQIVFIPKEYRELKDKRKLEGKLFNEIEQVCYDIIRKRFYMSPKSESVYLPYKEESSTGSTILAPTAWASVENTLPEGVLPHSTFLNSYDEIFKPKNTTQSGFRFKLARWKYTLRTILTFDFIFGLRMKICTLKYNKLKILIPCIVYDVNRHIEKKLERLETTITQYNRLKQRGYKEITVYHSEQERPPTRNSSPPLKSKQAVVVFKNVILAHFFDQLLLSASTSSMKEKILGIKPEDIHWKNITLTNRLVLMSRVALSNFLSVMVIVGWVIPVAFVGLISQIPFLAKLVPLPSWSANSTSILDKSLSSIVPVMTLIFLTEGVPFLFRWFGWLKCCRSGSSTELDVQKWFFAFLFVHIFLVVTISSGISVIVEKLVNNPVSIPDLLGTNLPKSSNFFCSFMLIRGLSYFGGNFMQVKSLLFELFYYRWKVYTPRAVFERNVNVQQYQWGSVYPMFSVLACIGIIYCVISPIILLFASFSFALVMFSFKYSIKYQYNPVNNSESYGKYYPTALMQLYAGIYFLEICLIGLFTLSNCYRLSIGMIIVLIFTISAHFQIWSNYKYHLDHMPAQLCMEAIQNTPYNFRIPSLEGHERQVWLPNDTVGVSSSLKILLEEKYELPCQQNDCHLDENGKLVLTGYSS